MGAAGMVHALELIHEMLTANGRLIDIHPNGEPPPITVRLGDERHLVGWVREESDYVSYGQADDALETAVARRLYTRDQQTTFAFTTYADDLPGLQSYLAENWSDGYIEPLVARRIEDLLHTALPDSGLILEEIIKITLLISTSK